MRNLLRIILSIGLVGSVGCTGMESVMTTETALDRVNRGKSINDGNTPQCLVEYEEFSLDVKLAAFEIYSKKGFEFGFSLSGLLKLLGFSFKTEKGVMTLYMGLSESIDPTNWVSYVEGNATMNKKDFRFNIGIDQFSGGMSYFKQTPMSRLTGNAVKNGLYNLQQELDRKVVRWKTRVVFAEEDKQMLVLPVGAVSGLQAGDLFNIYNVNYIWKDQPCESELLIPQKTTTEPLAVVQAVQVENNATVVRIIEKNFDEPIDMGAMVEVAQLAGENRQLYQPVSVRNVMAQPLPIAGIEDMDLTLFLDEQSRAFMDLYGFHPRN